MTVPTYSAGVMIVSRSSGSSMKSTFCCGGISEGFEITSTLPFVKCATYPTDGLVAIIERLNSRSSRSRTISICNRPRKPQRKPNPSATDVSGW